jgi:hypothetical protein
MQVKKIWAMSALAVVTMLTACGGGSSAGSSTPSLTGTVAVGAPLKGATVKLKDKNDKTAQVTANSDGSYTFSDVTGFIAPVMLEATGTANGKDVALHSVLETVPTGNTAGVLNATPATEVVTAHTLGGDPATAFQDSNQIKNIDTAKLKQAKDNLATALGTADLFTTRFNADGTGLDQVLDLTSFARNSDTEILVVNKSTRKQVALNLNVTPTKDIAALSADEKNLDTSGIKTLMTSLNAILGSESSILTGMPNLISDYYKQEGRNKSAIINLFAQDLVGTTYTGYTIDGCNASISVASIGQTCNVNFSILLQDKSTTIFSTAVVFDNTTKKWLLLGDQSPFPFDLKPVVYAEYGVSANGIIGTPTVQIGMNLWIPTEGNSYGSAKLSYSLDGGSPTSYVTLQEFERSQTCASGFLNVLSAGNAQPNCSNIFRVLDDLASSMNNAAKEGKYKLKIDVYTSSDRSGNPAASFELAGKLQYTTTTGNNALNSSGISITGADLGTNAVRFIGNNLDYVDIDSTYTSANTATASWGDSSPISELNGVASIQKANAQCLAKKDTDCDNKFSSSSVISRIFITKRDTLGRAVLANYYQEY